MATERDLLLELVNRHSWWYHTMDLGHGVSTPGRYGKNLVPVASLLKHLNLQGASCLDIGTMDGKMAFLMEKLGGDVVTADVFERESVIDLVQHFSTKINYVPGIRDSNLEELKASFGYFDFVLCAGVLYHIYSPMDLIANVRKIIKNGGYAIFESACLRSEKKSHMRLNWGDLHTEHTSIWVPTIACLKKMLQYFGFEIVGDAIFRGLVIRYAVLCRATAPSEGGKLTDDPWLSALLLKQTPGISADYLLPQLDIDGFESAPASEIAQVEGLEARRIFNPLRPKKYLAESEFLDLGTPRP